MVTKNYYKTIIRYIVLLAIYYPLFYLIFFYIFYFRVSFYIGYSPVYKGPDPEALSQKIPWFTAYSVELNRWSNYILYSIIIIFGYGIACLIFRKNILKINKPHFIILFITIILFLISMGKLGWYVD